MADVQLEKGHVQIANRLLEAIVDADFTGAQLKILLALFRLTYGWRRRTVGVSIAELAQLVRLSPTGGFRRAFDELIDNKVVIEVKDGRGRLYAVQKNFESWGRFGGNEDRLASLWGKRPKANDGALRHVTVTPQGQFDDDDSSIDSDPTGSSDGDPTGSVFEKTTVTLQGESHSPDRVTMTPRKSLNGEIYNAGKTGKTVVSSRSTDPKTGAGIARTTREPPTRDAPSATEKFLASMSADTRGEWRSELAALEHDYGAQLVERVCRDALMLKEPITTPRVFRIFCRSADEDARTAKPASPPIAQPVASARTVAEERDELAAYDADRREAGSVWRADHEDAFATMLDEAKHVIGPGLSLPRGAAYAEKAALLAAADAAGFPPFESWQAHRQAQRISGDRSESGPKTKERPKGGVIVDFDTS